eukprot:scaffold196080_cov24-Prasinocladus_malaysianus.AAC.1
MNSLTVITSQSDDESARAHQALAQLLTSAGGQEKNCTGRKATYKGDNLNRRNVTQSRAQLVGTRIATYHPYIFA